jgi:hypothetical protein
MAFEPSGEEIDVLACFLHGENVRLATEDIQLSLPVIKDIVYLLFHHRYLKNVDGSIHFNKDDIEDTPLIITAKGHRFLVGH